MNQPTPQSDLSFSDDEPALPHLGFEGIIALLIFWLLALDVFLQFFSRYVLNDSIGWTEEAARYLLVAVTFIGSAIAVRNNSHIMVEFFYRYLGPGLARALSTVVDLLRIAFFAYLAYLAYIVAERTTQRMAAIPLPKAWLYYLVVLALVLCALRAVWVAIQHWREGGSLLTQPIRPVE